MIWFNKKCQKTGEDKLRENNHCESSAIDNPTQGKGSFKGKQFQKFNCKSVQ